MTSTALPLPDLFARETLARAVSMLEALGLEVMCYALGGGTALAARWRHRRSVDIDLTVEALIYSPIQKRLGTEGILEILKNQGAVDINVLEEMIFWKIPLEDDPSGGSPRIGEVSLVAETAPTGLEPGKEHEAQHGVPLEQTSWILMKKLEARILQMGKCYSRDAYDLVVAAEKDPESLIRAMAKTNREQMKLVSSCILNELEIDPEWGGDEAGTALNRRIIQPHDRDLAEKRLWWETALLLEEGPEAYIRRLVD